MYRSPFSLRFSAASLASTLALACSEPTSPTPTTEASATSLAAATVTRFTDRFFNTVTDESTGLMALLGITADQLSLACAGQPFTLDEVSILEVRRPDGSLKITVHGNDLTVLVYSDIVDDVCELAGVVPLATGTAKVTQTDNDVFVSHNRTNSFGLSLVGRASAAEAGTHYLVRARFRATISKQDLVVRRSFNVSIRPVGQ